MKYTFFLIFLVLTQGTLKAQWKTAALNEKSSIILTDHHPVKNYNTHRKAGQPVLMEGYPITFSADPTFKNFRNVTLADLDSDGKDEIIAGINDHLYVLKNDSIWWSQSLSGIARFPAAVGDLNLDGMLEIVLLTGYNGDPGLIYVFNFDGSTSEGWPQTFSNRWMISSPALADIDQDDTLEIICSDLDGTMGHVHILKYDGANFSDQWPLLLPNIPAVTPSIADLNGDRRQDIVIASTREIYAFDTQGRITGQWPLSNGLTKFSFQSPILADLTGDGKLEVVAEGHGDLPQFMVLNDKGEFLPGWPITVPGNRWTFHTPTVIQYEGSPLILTARPISNAPADMLYARRPDGSMLSGFPIVKEGGLEGLITVADIDNDGEPELLFPSNLFDDKGFGFIHAYEMEGTGDIEGFPLRPYGLTYLNGATIGDVDGDQMMDLVVLSYTEHFEDTPDSAFLSVYNLSVPINENNVLWSTYKGNNLRNGYISLDHTTSDHHVDQLTLLDVFPNPANEMLHFQWAFDDEVMCQIVDVPGNVWHTSNYAFNVNEAHVPTGHFPSGVYFLKMKSLTGETFIIKKLMIN